MRIRYADQADTDFWLSLDRHIDKQILLQKIADNQCYVLENDQRKIGVLRYNLFWDNTPFCTLLFIHPDFQHIGYGKAMMAHWEKEMKANGYGMVMTSTQVDEMAQHFYRKLGYKDAGGIIFEIPGFEQPMEMIMIKGI